MNKSVTSHLGEVNKSVASVAQKFAARFDEQDRRLDALSTAVDQASQNTHVRGGKAGARQPAPKPVPRSAQMLSSDTTGGEPVTPSAALPVQAEAAASTSESEESPRPQVSQSGEPSDKLE